MKKILGSVFTVVLLAAFLFLLFVALSRAQTSSEIVATGGSFQLEKAAVAGGGGVKQMSTTIENGTAGQAVAGARSMGGAFLVSGGFWTPDDFAPTAAQVSVGGRITDASGIALRNVAVTITSQSGVVRSTLSTTFGYYTFGEVEAGETYILTVHSTRHTFAEPIRTIHVADEITDANFVSTPE